VIDYFEGSPRSLSPIANLVPTRSLWLIGDNYPPNYDDPNLVFDRESWKSRHTHEIIYPILKKAIEGLRAKGYNRFASHGYCFGAKPGVELVRDGVTSVFIASQ
jgi:hypothetical protein